MVDRRIVTTLAKDRPSYKKMQGRDGMAGDVLVDGDKVLKEEAHYVYRRHGKECFVCGTKSNAEGDGGEEPVLVPGMPRRHARN